MNEMSQLEKQLGLRPKLRYRPLPAVTLTNNAIEALDQYTLDQLKSFIKNNTKRSNSRLFWSITQVILPKKSELPNSHRPSKSLGRRKTNNTTKTNKHKKALPRLLELTQSSQLSLIKRKKNKKKNQNGLSKTVRDLSKVKCFSYQKIGHYANDCLEPKNQFWSQRPLCWWLELV